MSNSSTQGEEEGTKVIEEIGESVLNAVMPSGDDGQALNERERRARAAMARFENTNDTTTSTASSQANLKNDAVHDWALVTPEEDDIEELIECIMEGSSAEGVANNYDEDTAKAWAGILLDSVRNWRVLANSDAELILFLLTDKSPNLPSSETIEKWIDAAQSRAMEEIMLEILDGDQDALEVLVDKARSGSPRELKYWETQPGMLLDLISGSEETTKKWEKLDVMRWISRAKIALGACPWLELYTTAAAP
jgi:hypothetical protein